MLEAAVLTTFWAENSRPFALSHVWTRRNGPGLAMQIALASGEPVGSVPLVQ